MKLSVQIEFDKTLDLLTNKTSAVVGRSPEKCDLVIKHDSISRQHCRIDFEKGSFFITDLGSSNGVFINKHKIHPQVKTPLNSASQLTLGKLDCLITDQMKSSEETKSKILSTTIGHSGEYTSTIRIARLDLQQGADRPLELEQKKKVIKKARNPISGKREVEVKKTNLAGLVIFLGLLVAAAAAYYVMKVFN